MLRTGSVKTFAEAAKEELHAQSKLPPSQRQSQTRSTFSSIRDFIEHSFPANSELMGVAKIVNEHILQMDGQSVVEKATATDIDNPAFVLADELIELFEGLIDDKKETTSGDDDAWEMPDNMSPNLLKIFDKSGVRGNTTEASEWIAPAFSGLGNSERILPLRSFGGSTSCESLASPIHGRNKGTAEQEEEQEEEEEEEESAEEEDEDEEDEDAELDEDGIPYGMRMSANLMAAMGIRVDDDNDTSTDWKPPTHPGLSNSSRIIN